MMQQPKKILNLLIAQYITGICGLRPKGFDSKRSCLHQGMVSIHLYMDSSYIYQEYKNWFSIYSNLSDFEQRQLHHWVCFFYISWLKYILFRIKVNHSAG